jgi:hypothetical protein
MTRHIEIDMRKEATSLDDTRGDDLKMKCSKCGDPLHTLLDLWRHTEGVCQERTTERPKRDSETLII